MHSKKMAIVLLVVAVGLFIGSLDGGVRQGLPSIALDWLFGLKLIRAAVAFAIVAALLMLVVRGWGGMWPERFLTTGVEYSSANKDLERDTDGLRKPFLQTSHEFEVAGNTEPTERNRFMSGVGYAKRAWSGRTAPDEAQKTEADRARSMPAGMSSPLGDRAGEQPIANPDFSVAGLNPVFTKASPPPPRPAGDAIRALQDARIGELARLLAATSRRTERGTAVSERSRRRR